jgi:hypothetical protein
LQKLETAIKTTRQSHATIPVSLVINNISTTNIRNIYGEIEIKSSSKRTEISESDPTRKLWSSTVQFNPVFYEHLFAEDSRFAVRDAKDFDKFRAGVLHLRGAGLVHTADGCKLSFEWDALQAQRIRLIEPILYAYCPEDASILILLKLFTDYSPNPFTLTAEIFVEAENKNTTLDEFIPKWKELT